MSQSFDLSTITTLELDGADCSKLMLDGVRIWERYTAYQDVWVTSGYNSTSWGNGWTMWNYNHFYMHNAESYGHTLVRWNYQNDTSYPQLDSPWIPGHPTVWYGWGYKFVRGAKKHEFSSGSKRYELTRYEEVTTWVDTSHWESQSYTAYYY